MCYQTKDMDGGFLWWLLHAEMEALRTLAVGSTYEAVTAEDIGSLRVRIPSLPKQLSIADFLDSETARIDALIEKKQRMVALLEERRSGAVELAIRGMVDKWGTKPLKYAVGKVEVGIVITPSAWYADEGVVALRGLNVRPGNLDLDDVVHISEDGQRLHTKSVLHAGDVVVVRTGQAGAACVVPTSVDGCNCIDLVIVRKGTELLPKFLEFVLNADWTQKHIEEFSVGTIQSHFNVGAMQEVPVPSPPLAEQEALVQGLQADTDELTVTVSKLSRQIEFIQEPPGSHYRCRNRGA